MFPHLNKSIFALILLGILSVSLCDIKVKLSLNRNIYKHISIKNIIDNSLGNHHEINMIYGPVTIKYIDIKTFNEPKSIQNNENKDNLKLVFEDYEIDITVTALLKLPLLSEKTLKYDVGATVSFYLNLSYLNDKPEVISAEMNIIDIRLGETSLQKSFGKYLSGINEAIINLLKNKLNELMVSFLPNANKALTDVLDTKFEVPFMEDKNIIFAFDKIKQFSNDKNQWIIGALINASIDKNIEENKLNMSFSPISYDKLACFYMDSEIFVSLLNFSLQNSDNSRLVESDIKVKKVTFKEDESINIILEVKVKVSFFVKKENITVLLKAKKINDILQFEVSMSNLSYVGKLIAGLVNAVDKLADYMNEFIINITKTLSAQINAFKKTENTKVKIIEKITNENMDICVDF